MNYSTLASEFPGLQIKTSINRYNLGITQNIARCVEFASTPVVVWLGDDDKICTDYLARVFVAKKQLDDDPKLIGICHSTAITKKPRSITADSVPELVDALENFGDILFISNWVIKTRLYCEKLFWVNSKASGAYAIIAPFLMCLNEGYKLSISKDSLVVYEPTPLEKKWSWFSLYQGAYGIFELPLGLSSSDFENFKKTVISYGDRNLSFLYFSLLGQTDGSVSSEQKWVFRKLRSLYRGLWDRQRVPGWLLVMGLEHPCLRKVIHLLHRITKSVQQPQITKSFSKSL